MLIIVAAGNEGPYSSSIASPSIGKNVLSGKVTRFNNLFVAKEKLMNILVLA